MGLVKALCPSVSLQVGNVPHYERKIIPLSCKYTCNSRGGAMRKEHSVKRIAKKNLALNFFSPCSMRYAPSANRIAEKKYS